MPLLLWLPDLPVKLLKITWKSLKSPGSIRYVSACIQPLSAHSAVYVSLLYVNYG